MKQYTYEIGEHIDLTPKPEELPEDYEVGEFKIYRDGILDRKALYKQRTRHAIGFLAAGAVTVAKATFEGADTFISAMNEEFNN